jgi:hypothetical protein
LILMLQLVVSLFFLMVTDALTFFGSLFSIIHCSASASCYLLFVGVGRSCDTYTPCCCCCTSALQFGERGRQGVTRNTATSQSAIHARQSVWMF